MKKQKIMLVSAAILSIVIIISACAIHNSNLNTYMRRDIDNRLLESVTPNIMSFELQLQEQVKKVNTFADFLGKNWNLDLSVHVSLLQSAVVNNGLLRCAIAYPDGRFITHDNKNDGNVSNDEFFIANQNGEFFITDPRPAIVDPSKKVILFSAPILNNNGEFLGSLTYSYLCDDMNKIFNLKSMGGEMNMVVLNKDGELLVGTSEHETNGKALINSLRDKCTHSQHDANDCISLEGSSGTVTLSLAKAENITYFRYDKLNLKDWYIVSGISEHSAMTSVVYSTQNQQLLIFVIAFVLIGFCLLFLALWLAQKKSIDFETKALTLYAFKREAKKLLAARKTENYVIVQLDVKNFKLINRIYSFAVGDALIKAVANALRAVLLDTKSIYSRIGIDTFVFMMPYENADTLDKKRTEFINHFKALMDKSFTTKVIFPTGQYILKPTDYPSPDISELLEKVNFSHKFAKQKWDDIIDYEEDIERIALFEKTVEDRMESAIRDEEFTLYLQPKVLLSDETLFGAEALVRWKLGDKFYMYPTDFVPIFERNGFIVQLDKYMFRCVAKYLRGRMDSGLPMFPISVNFSRQHIGEVNFVNDICDIASEYNVPSNYFEIELTESAFLGNIDDTIELIDKLHNKGFVISMDDFGSGYSCFAQLKDLKIDILKLDKGFFSQGDTLDRLKFVIAGIVKIARDLHITTVAEGVETIEQAQMLRDLGCDIVQGYYYAKPMPSVELDTLNFKEH